MAGRFSLHRSKLTRAQAQRNVEISDERIAKLVALATSLADRMDAMPPAGPEHDRDRRDRVQVLRRTAEASRRTLTARGGASTDGPSQEHTA